MPPYIFRPTCSALHFPFLLIGRRALRSSRFAASTGVPGLAYWYTLFSTVRGLSAGLPGAWRINPLLTSFGTFEDNVAHSNFRALTFYPRGYNPPAVSRVRYSIPPGRYVLIWCNYPPPPNLSAPPRSQNSWFSAGIGERRERGKKRGFGHCLLPRAQLKPPKVGRHFAHEMHV